MASKETEERFELKTLKDAEVTLKNTIRYAISKHQVLNQQKAVDVSLLTDNILTELFHHSCLWAIDMILTEKRVEAESGKQRN